MNCDFCEKQIPIGIGICPHCGKPQGVPGTRGRQFMWFVAAMVAMFGIAIAQHYLFYSH